MYASATAPLAPPLAGREAIFTGRASGIGPACVRALPRLAAAVTAADLSDARASVVGSEIGGTAGESNLRPLEPDRLGPSKILLAESSIKRLVEPSEVASWVGPDSSMVTGAPHTIVGWMTR